MFPVNLFVLVLVSSCGEYCIGREILGDEFLLIVFVYLIMCWSLVFTQSSIVKDSPKATINYSRSNIYIWGEIIFCQNNCSCVPQKNQCANKELNFCKIMGAGG